MLKKERQIYKFMKGAGFAFDSSKDLFDGAFKGISMDFIFEKIKEAQKMATKKLLRGLKNIHFAKWNGSTFEAPVRISTAKRTENQSINET